MNPGIEGLKIISSRERRRRGESSSYPKLLERNVLANEVVRHFSNLTAKGCGESTNRVLSAK